MTKNGVGNNKWRRLGYENKGRRTVIQSQREQKYARRWKEKQHKDDHKGPRFEMLKLLMLSSKSSVARV